MAARKEAGTEDTFDAYTRSLEGQRVRVELVTGTTDQGVLEVHPGYVTFAGRRGATSIASIARIAPKRLDALRALTDAYYAVHPDELTTVKLDSLRSLLAEVRKVAKAARLELTDHPGRPGHLCVGDLVLYVDGDGFHIRRDVTFTEAKYATYKSKPVDGIVFDSVSRTYVGTDGRPALDVAAEEIARALTPASVAPRPPRLRGND
jgi:hypothetical protein